MASGADSSHTLAIATAIPPDDTGAQQEEDQSAKKTKKEPTTPAPTRKRPSNLRDDRNVATSANISEHKVADKGDGSTEQRLMTLEHQHAIDHEHFANIKTVIDQMIMAVSNIKEQQNNSNTAIDETRRMIFDMKQEIAAVRTTTDAGKQKTNEHNTVVTMLQVEIESKLLQMQNAINTMNAQETLIKEYLVNFDAQRPLEGDVVRNEFISVRSAVKAIEAKVTEVEARGGGVKGLDPKKMDTLDHMYKQVEFPTSFANEARERINYNLTLSSNLADGVAQLSAQIDGISLKIAADDCCDQAHESNQFMTAPCGQGFAGCPQQGHSWAAPSGGGQLPGSSGDGSPLNEQLKEIVGGNGRCHCVHVKALLERVNDLEGRGQRGPDPIANAWPQRPEQARSGGEAPPTEWSLPLRLPRPLGAIAAKDREIFDIKLTGQDAYRYNGVKNGLNWKGKLERYFISRAPVLKELLKWIEAQDSIVSDGRLAEAVGRTMSEEQLALVNAGLWGFISAAVSGTAETIFKGAAMLCGFEAWRRMVKFIQHGLPIRRETLRREVRALHTKKIKDLDVIDEGIAEFDNTINEYLQVGGVAADPEELKSDLLNILPGALRENLLWQASDTSKTYEQFRDMILLQAAKISLNRPQRGVHNLEDESHEPENIGNLVLADFDNVDELIAAFQRYDAGGGRGTRPQTRPQPRADTRQTQDRRQDARGPKKCPNCSKEHADRRCPEPPRKVSDRACWECDQKGHTARQCPNKKAKAIRAVDEPEPCFMLSEGFSAPKRTAKPQRQPVTLANFVHAAAFDKLKDDSELENDQETATSSCSSPSMSQRERKSIHHNRLQKSAKGGATVEASSRILTLHPDKLTLDDHRRRDPRGARRGTEGTRQGGDHAREGPRDV